METPDAIIVLSGGIKQVDGHWMSTDLTEEDNTQGAPGASLRVTATAVLSNQHPSALVIVSGGKGYDVPKDISGDRPLLCEILRKELLVAGVTEERIELEEISNTTYGQLVEIEKIAHERGWNNILLVTNRWHLPRLRAMLKAKFEETNLHGIVEPVSAEEVLLRKDKEKWGTPIRDAYASEWLTRRMELEERGIKQINERTYIWRS